MTLINKHISAFFAGIYSAILALLGYGCTPEDQYDMYGMPTGTFEIKGAVTSDEGISVKNAEIRVTYPDAPSGVYSLETTTTNIDGQYITKGSTTVEPELKVVCIPYNPNLEADSVIVDLVYKDSNKKSTWDWGHAKATVDFKLKAKNTEE